jgi:hypothetical protein
MIKQLLLSPPLAIARLGSSETPLECFYWGPNDDRPRGTGKTTIIPGETLSIANDGSVFSFTPSVIQFKDGDKFRPVCPFFELHGVWELEGQTIRGPITMEVLQQFGFSSEHLQWKVHAGNLKAFHMTQDRACRIEARETIAGDHVEPVVLRGVSPSDASNPLVPAGHYVPLGTVRLTRPNDEFPEYRLRFIPAKGKFYGPPGLKERWDVEVPPDQLFLNPDATWVGFIPPSSDPRTSPGRLYAGEGSDSQACFGIVDDVCDAIISCSLLGSDVQPATARVTVSPPDYAPDRRHLISIADALKDHIDRSEVSQSDYVTANSIPAEIQDLFERIYETMGLMNVDVFNNRVDIQENRERAFSLGIPYKSTDHYAFSPIPATDEQKFPITERGRQFHRRMIAIEVIQDTLREKPELIDQWIRPPGGNDGFFTKQMPPVMRDSSGGPLHLTRRQYDLLRNWVKNLRRDVGAS